MDRENGFMDQNLENNKQFDSRISLLRYFLRGSIGTFSLSVLFAAAVSFLDMLLPRIISFTVDSVIADQAPDLPASVLAYLKMAGGVEMLRRYPAVIAAAVTGVALTAAVCRYLFRYLNEVAVERFVKRMRDNLYAKI